MESTPGGSTIWRNHPAKSIPAFLFGRGARAQNVRVDRTLSRSFRHSHIGSLTDTCCRQKKPWLPTASRGLFGPPMSLSSINDGVFHDVARRVGVESMLFKTTSILPSLKRSPNAAPRAEITAAKRFPLRAAPLQISRPSMFRKELRALRPRCTPNPNFCHGINVSPFATKRSSTRHCQIQKSCAPTKKVVGRTRGLRDNP